MDYRDVTVRLLGDVAGYVDKMGLAGDITGEFVKTITGVEQKLDSLRIAAGKASLAMGAGLQASLTGATFAAARWEAQFASVRKTVDATAGDLGKLERNLRSMSTQMPVSAGELANLAAIAGQLGVSTDKIDEFATVGAKLGVATELGSEQAIVSLSRLIKVMNASEGDIEGLGAALVQLGNVSNASEGPILDFAQNIAGTAGSFGIAADAVLGIATAFSEAGIESEAGGTAVQRVLIDMQTAAKTGGANLNVFARTLGMTSNQFKDLVANDPTEAFLKFNEALKAAGGDSIRILKDLNLDDARLIRAFTNVANSAGSMRDRVEESQEAFADPTALDKEAATRFNTLLESLKQFKNATAEILRSFGDPFVEAVTKVVKGMTWMVNLFNRIPDPIKDVIAIFAGLNAGFLIAVGSALLLAKTIGTVITVFKLLSTRIPLTVIKGLAAGLTEVTVAGKQMGYMSRGMNSQSLAMQRLFEFSRKAALGLRGVTAGMTQFLGLQAANKIKGIGLSLASMVAKPVGMLTGTTQAAKIVQDAAKMQQQINRQIGQQTGAIPISPFQKFTTAVKRGYYSMTASIGDAFRKIPDLGSTLNQQAGKTETAAQRIKRIFTDLSGTFRTMMNRVKSGGAGDSGFLDVGALLNGRRKKDRATDMTQVLQGFDDKPRKRPGRSKGGDEEAADKNKVTDALKNQSDAIEDVGRKSRKSADDKRADIDASDDMGDSAEDAAGGMGLLQIGITAAVVGWQLYSSWQDKVAAKMGSTQTQAKQVAESLNLVYSAAERLGNLKPPDTDKAPAYKSADFGKKFSEVLATMASRDGTDAQLDVVRNLIINTSLNGNVTPEFLKAMEDILKRVFGEKQGKEYFVTVKAGLVDSRGRATTAAEVRDQLKALDSYIPDLSGEGSVYGKKGDFAAGIESPGNVLKNIKNSVLGATGGMKQQLMSTAEAFVQAAGSDEAGGAAAAQAIMKQFLDGIDKETGNTTVRTRIKRQFFGLIEDASKGSDGKATIDFDWMTKSYADAIGDLQKNNPTAGFLDVGSTMADLERASRLGQINNRTAIAETKELIGLNKILADVKYEDAGGDNAAASSRFSRAVGISEQTQGLRETVKQVRAYRDALQEVDGEEYRRVNSELEKMENRLRNLDLKKLDADLGSMDGVEAIKRLDQEIAKLSSTVDGFDAEKLESLYGKREEAVARAEGELRGMVKMEEDLLKAQRDNRERHNERLAEMAKDRDKSLARETKNYRKRLAEIDKQEKEALKEQAERAAKEFTDFADPFSRIPASRTEGASAVAVNTRDQNAMFSTFQANLKKLKSMGLSSEVIEAMGLDDPKNMQQVARFMSDAIANPQVIKNLQAAWKDRIKLSEAFAKDDTKKATAEIKKNFKEMRDSAKESFEEAQASIRESYRETLADENKNFKKTANEISKQLGLIGKTTSDTLQTVIDKAMKSNNDMINDFVKRFLAAKDTVISAANEVKAALFAGPWWVFLGFTSSEAARKYGMTQADAMANGWNPDMARQTRQNTNTRQMDDDDARPPARSSGTATAILPPSQFKPQSGPVPVPQPRPAPAPKVPAPVIAPPPPKPATSYPNRNFVEGAYRTTSSPMTSTTRTTTNTTNFGPITVVAQDPTKMAAELRKKERLARLTRTPGGY